MTESTVRRLVVVTDDNFLAEMMSTYMKHDAIEIERVSTAEEAARRIAHGADGVLVDLAKREITADAIVSLSGDAIKWQIPMMILSTQPRRQVTDFASVVRAIDVVSKAESMPAIAARLRMRMRSPYWVPPMRNDRMSIISSAVMAA
jgi:DNA-binding response OmpR family regulator